MAKAYVIGHDYNCYDPHSNPVSGGNAPESCFPTTYYWWIGQGGNTQKCKCITDCITQMCQSPNKQAKTLNKNKDSHPNISTQCLKATSKCESKQKQRHYQSNWHLLNIYLHFTSVLHENMTHVRVYQTNKQRSTLLLRIGTEVHYIWVFKQYGLL